MSLEELIATEDLCSRYCVERTFIHSLYESGIIEIVKIEEKEYVHWDNLHQFERMRRLHQDLSINTEGLAAIHQLLQQVQDLQKLNQELKNRLDLYE